MHLIANVRDIQGNACYTVDATFWREWTKLPLVKSIITEGPDGQMTGFASGVRFPNNSYRIGPLYADSFEIAIVLINELVEHANVVKNEAEIDSVYFRVPSTNEKMIEFVTNLGFKLERVINRTYTKRDEIMVPLPDITYAIGVL